MRKIKFRVWNTNINRFMREDEKNDNYMDVTTGKLVSNCYSVHEYGNATEYYNDGSYKLLQFTGLLDKQGVEIYEGDVLKISNISVLRCEFRNGCFVLVHSKEFAGVDNLLWGNLGRLYDAGMNDIFELTEVIGNIYENPELLESKC